jgi:hypothetical protein
MTAAVTASSTTTLSNKTLTAPKFVDAGFIADANGNEQVVFQTTASAVNALEVTNSATSNAIVVGAFGSDSNVDIDITPKGTGEVNIAAGNLNYAGTAITTTGAEINLIDGDTARGTETVGTGDGILINDGGTMRMTNVDTVSTYFSSHSVGGTNIVTTGALNSGSITSGFSSIDIGGGALTATGAVTLGATTFGDNNITNVGNIALDSLTADGSTITITGNTTFADGAYDFDIASHDGSTGLKLGGVLVSVTAAEINAVTSKASTGKAIAMAMVFG